MKKKLKKNCEVLAPIIMITFFITKSSPNTFQGEESNKRNKDKKKNAPPSSGGGGHWTSLTPNTSSSSLTKKSRSRSRTPDIMITGAEDRQEDDNDSDVDDIPMLNAGTTPESLSSVIFFRGVLLRANTLTCLFCNTYC